MTKAAGRVGTGIGWALVALASAAAIALTAPAPAAAAGAQSVGWVPGPSAVGRQQTRCEPGVSFGWAQLASQNDLYTVPSNGVITSWTFQTGATAADELYLVVYRGGPAPDASYDNTGTYTPVAWSPALNVLPAGLGSQPTTLAFDPSQPANTAATYPARIPVMAGDVLGVAASCIDWYPSPSPNSSDFPFSALFNPPRPTGNPLGQSPQAFPYGHLVLETFADQGVSTLGQWPGFRLPVSAQVEPDTDGDGFGDVTQDLCPGQYGSVQGCPRADLSLAMAAPPTSPGPNATFTLTVTNNGPDPVPDATVTDPLPAGTSVQSVQSTSGTCGGSIVVSCQFTALATGQSATITLVLRGTAAGTLTNTADVTSQTLTMAAAAAPGAGDPNASNNFAFATTTLPAPTAGAATGQPSTTGGTRAAPPVLGNLRESSGDWREPRMRGPKLPVGDTFRFTLTTAATVTLSFVREQAGRRVHGSCVAQTRTNAGKARCTRTSRAGTLTVAGTTGANTLLFNGRLSSGGVLAPGTYTVTFVPTGPVGAAGTGHKLTFTITG